MLFDEEHLKESELHKTEFDTFMLERRIEDLQRLSAQMTRVNGGMSVLKDRWKRHVYDQGFKMLNDEQLAKKTFKAVEDFIEYKHKAEELVERVFQGKELQTTFKKMVRQAFEKFLNIDPNIIAEYLAKFLDMSLKRVAGSSGLSDEKLDKTLIDVLDLFKATNAKDVFEEFYMRGMARRLLLKKSASTDAERAVIAKLKIECSNEFGTKADAMLRDLQESDTFCKEYTKMRGGEDVLIEKFDGTEANFHILSQGAWPIR